MRKIIKPWVVTLIVCVIAFVVGVVVLRRDVSQLPFSSAQWKASADPLLRGRMVQDLIGQRLLNGKGREQVAMLLGPPDGTVDDLIFYKVDIGQRLFFAPWIYNLELTLSEGVVVDIKLAD